MTKINVWCSNWGWLFEDLKQHFLTLACYAGFDGDPRFQLTISDEPEPDADVWICLRSSEANKCPWPTKQIVQIHCNERRLIAQGDMVIDAVNRAAGYVFTHHSQPIVLQGMGMDLSNARCLLRPIGALEAFTVRGQLFNDGPARIGWIGRDTGTNKRVDVFVDAVRRAAKRVDCMGVLLGSQLQRADERFGDAPSVLYDTDKGHINIRHYPDIYKTLDAVVITSIDEAGPMPLFEALATGVPVITTPCGWARMIIPGINGTIVLPDASGIARQIELLVQARKEVFTKRHLIRSTLNGFTLEGWVYDNIRMALEVASE
jgi:glycosyltransferase involved in cell wall biosynthesis